MTPPRASRLPGIDVARGLATVLMIQTHAYDAWVAPEARTSAAFQLTRALGTLPLPMFLLLAGMSCALRVRRAIERSERAGDVRHGLVKNALEVVAWGYALNVLYALLDGARGLDTLLRVDVLHAIGLSLLVVALGVHGSEAPRRGVFVVTSVLLTVLPVALSPWLTPLGATAQGALRYALAPFVEVPGLSPMPLVPLASLAGLGALIGLHHHEPVSRRVLASYAGLGSVAVGVGLAGYAWARAAGIPISRAQPTIALNALDLAGRASLAFALSFVATARVPAWTTGLGRVGQQSLFVYGLHLPFCYGRFGRPLKRALDMGHASLWLVALVALCGLAVYVRERLRRSKSAGPPLSLGP